MTRSHVANLRKGRKDSPGYEKMLAIARTMGLPPALWFEEAPGEDTRAAPAKDQDLAGRVGHLFDTIRHPRTDEPYANSEVARMSAGGLTEEEVEGMRTGSSPPRRWDRSRRLRPSSAWSPNIWWPPKSRRLWTRSYLRACQHEPPIA